MCCLISNILFFFKPTKKSNLRKFSIFLQVPLFHSYFLRNGWMSWLSYCNAMPLLNGCNCSPISTLENVCLFHQSFASTPSRSAGNWIKSGHWGLQWIYIIDMISCVFIHNLRQEAVFIQCLLKMCIDWWLKFAFCTSDLWCFGKAFVCLRYWNISHINECVAVEFNWFVDFWVNSELMSRFFEMNPLMIFNW